MTDIVERLVTLAACGAFSSGDKAIMLMTADAIEERDAEIVRLRALITEWAEADVDVESMSRTGDGTTREWDKARRRNRDARLALHEECQPMKRNDRNAHAD